MIYPAEKQGFRNHFIFWSKHLIVSLIQAYKADSGLSFYLLVPTLNLYI